MNKQYAVDHSEQRVRGTIETVEKHYTPFGRELRERPRMILETGAGLENLSKIQANDPQSAAQTPK